MSYHSMVCPYICTTIGCMRAPCLATPHPAHYTPHPARIELPAYAVRPGPHTRTAPTRQRTARRQRAHPCTRTAAAIRTRRAGANPAHRAADTPCTPHTAAPRLRAPPGPALAAARYVRFCLAARQQRTPPRVAAGP